MKIDRKINKKGYVMLYKPDHPYNIKNYVMEHRIVVENKIGRHLLPSEIIHHVNEVKDDNRIENLMLFNSKEHSSFHNKVRQFGFTNNIKRQIKNMWKNG